MEEEITSVSYGHSGYETMEDEAEERHEAREYFRRKLLRGIRGRLRENGGLRWWLAFVMAWCCLLAWAVAWAVHATGRFGWIWLPALGVLATWPLYVLALKWRARREAHRLDLAGHWDSLKTADECGEIHDNEISQKVDNAVEIAWNSNRGQGAFAGAMILTIVTIGTWAVWDLLRMGPALMAEIILDGEIVPTYPAIKERMPYEPWYKTALLNTAVHFVSVAGAVTLLAVFWKFRGFSR